MRTITSSWILLFCLGLAVAGPLAKKIEKKSISNSLAPKAIESEQQLDEPKLADEALMEAASANVDRAKKEASTTFCVEIRQNKPTQVDCDELKPTQPPPTNEEPQILPQPRPEVLQIQPCEPEIGAYYVQSPGEIVYAPTGKCAQPSSGVIQVPAGVSGTPGIQLFHLHAGASAQPAVHYGHPAGASMIPLHVHQHAHHRLTGGVECSCKQGLSLAKSADDADASKINEALAMKFLQDVQRNADAQKPAPPPMIQVPVDVTKQMTGPLVTPIMNMGQNSAPSMMVPATSSGSAPTMMLSPMPVMTAGAPVQLSPKSNARYSSHVPPMMQQQMIRGLHNFPMHGQSMNQMMIGGSGIMSPMMRSKTDCLEDGLKSGHTVQGLRLSRGPNKDDEAKNDENDDGNKASPMSIMKQMKMSDEGTKLEEKDEKNSRIARYVMSDKDAASNTLEG